MLSIGHPHNDYLQIDVELGIIGCVLAMTVALMLLWYWRHLQGPALWSRIGLFGMAATTMLVGHGAWRPWWISAVLTGAALIGILAPTGYEQTAAAGLQQRP